MNRDLGQSSTPALDEPPPHLGWSSRGIAVAARSPHHRLSTEPSSYSHSLTNDRHSAKALSCDRSDPASSRERNPPSDRPDTNRCLVCNSPTVRKTPKRVRMHCNQPVAQLPKRCHTTSTIGLFVYSVSLFHILYILWCKYIKKATLSKKRM